MWFPEIYVKIVYRSNYRKLRKYMWKHGTLDYVTEGMVNRILSQGLMVKLEIKWLNEKISDLDGEIDILRNNSRKEREKFLNERKINLNNKSRDRKIKATCIDTIKISEAKGKNRKPNEVCKPKKKEKQELNYLYDENKNLLLAK